MRPQVSPKGICWLRIFGVASRQCHLRVRVGYFSIVGLKLQVGYLLQGRMV